MTGEGIWYDWLHAPEPPDLQSAPGHHLVREDAWSGRLSLRILCLSPLHLGSGEYAVDGSGRVLLDVARRAGRPVIPGASLKGLVRATAEAVSRSCGPGFPTCPAGSGQQARACPACRLFGWVQERSHFRSRVRFGEFDLAGDPAQALEVARLPNLFQPRVRRPDSRKFYLHSKSQESGPIPALVARPKSVFSGEVWFENLSRDELALLAFALALDGSFQPKLGHAKSAYFGSIQVELASASLRRGLSAAELNLTSLAAGYGARDEQVQRRVARLRELWSWEKPKGKKWPPPSAPRREGGRR